MRKVLFVFLLCTFWFLFITPAVVRFIFGLVF